ncbi:hypothetical protein ACLKMH_09420 [Psychromonas sp. KJ10-10]|uniref:hypothetical protein n=1 Tax=Psychromonas sp. KJ10-10 TaxID=3391823 RepID=UPI0039B699A3
MEKKSLILGPSHIMRWIQSINTAIIPSLTNVDFHGRGGAPIWGDFIKNKFNDFNNYNQIIFIVGDFRFGNKVLIDDSEIRNQHGIEKELISVQNDREMYDKVVNELLYLSHSRYKSKIKFIFWDLALREHKNRKENKYTTNEEYKHPIWNLHQIQCQFENNTIKIDSEMNLDSLYIDGSNHPSFLGYVYLYKLIFGYINSISVIDLFPLQDYLITE